MASIDELFGNRRRARRKLGSGRYMLGSWDFPAVSPAEVGTAVNRLELGRLRIGRAEARVGLADHGWSEGGSRDRPSCRLRRGGLMGRLMPLLADEAVPPPRLGGAPRRTADSRDDLSIAVQLRAFS